MDINEKICNLVRKFPAPPRPPNAEKLSCLFFEIETKKSKLKRAKYEGEQEMWTRCFAAFKELL